ncbi:hypothetical protein [Ekhidna sp.]|uniref:hypothetical protein n=1 Tax=Ekhidna sp. TaxID=2608089 RepID=UPI003C7D5661
MKIISLNSNNLNNSLVFYRSLLDQMPEDIGPNVIRFKTDQFRLDIIESVNDAEDGHHVLEVKDHSVLQEINRRMSRFRKIERLKEECENIGKAIGLTDPDGNKWVIGNPEVTVHFEKCYIDSEIF